MASVLDIYHRRTIIYWSMNKQLHKKVLFVDNSSSLRKSVDSALSDSGLDVLNAAGGAEGLRIIKQLEAEKESLGLIITDINISDMDGFAFIKEVKKTVFNHVPILVLTAESEDSKKLAGKVAGASGWMLKPFSEKHLMPVVSKFLR